MQPPSQAQTAGNTWYRLLAAISERDFITVVGFCAAGLLATLNAMLLFPDWGNLIQQYNQF
jgi:hypothetical protein